MAGRIKGITVEINGDTTKLSKALQSVDRNIKNTQTQDLVITRGLVIVQEVTAVNHRLHIHKQETKLQLLLQH